MGFRDRREESGLEIVLSSPVSGFRTLSFSLPHDALGGSREPIWDDVLVRRSIHIRTPWLARRLMRLHILFAEAEVGAVDPHAVEHDGEFPDQSHGSAPQTAAFGNHYRSTLQTEEVFLPGE